jgi:hypothetical protein
MDILSVVLSGHSTGVVVGFAEILVTNCETGAQRIVVEGIAKCFIRLVIPWKCHVEHANESPFFYVTDIANRDPVVETFRIWFPQCEAMIWGRELLLVYVERLLCCHDGRKVGECVPATRRHDELY